MLAKFSRHSLLAAIAVFASLTVVRVGVAQDHSATTTHAAESQHSTTAPAEPVGDDAEGHGHEAGHEAGAALQNGHAPNDETEGQHGEGQHAEGEPHGEAAGPRPVFEPEHATWFNVVARNIFATPEEKAHMAQAEKDYAALQQKAAGGAKLSKEEEEHLKAGVHYVTKYDWLLYTPLLWLLLAIAMVSAARKASLRPAGKPASLANTVEAAVDGFQDYLIGVMGEGLARKYAALIASFFFTILVSNWLGLIPGMLAASAQPAVPISIAIVAFIAVHVIAIKEAGVKSWFMHFVGEPVWLAPLNFPLHIVGEFIKPLSLSLRLLCNVFGEEAVIATLTALAISTLPAWLPIPFQLPMLLLGTFFGFLQALVFSTLLAIYISILATHHDDHDEHNHHGHVEHDDIKGRHQIVAHPSQMTVG